MTHGPGLVIVLALYATLLNKAQADCQTQRIDLRTTVGRVLDGDTIELSDRRRIRLIGINAPEFARRGRPAEALAAQAKNTLSTLLNKSGHRIALRYGADPQDRYGRTLAHIFLPDGTNLAQQLILKGLAVRIAFPPNMWAQDCYKLAESDARRHQRGLWQHIVTASDALPANSKGFHIIEGTIDRVGYSKKSVWLNFKGRFAVRIARKELKHFRDIDFKKLTGRTLQVRGWVYDNNKQRIMRLRHSSMLDIMK
jgi:endonuclease YncB( thermonuclease family)